MTPRVVITRPISPSLTERNFESEIESLGYETITAPVFEYELIPNQSIVEERFTWHVFTSPAGVFFFNALNKRIKTQPHLNKIAVQGEGTARELELVFHRKPDLMPKDFISEALAEALLKVVTPNDSVLIPCSVKSRGIVEEKLKEKNINVKVLPIYTLAPIETPLPTIFESDFLVFFSPSAVESFKKKITSPSIYKAKVITVGPITGRAVKEAGFVSVREASEHSEKGVIDVLASLV